jgi:hypothetical protein
MCYDKKAIFGENLVIKGVTEDAYSNRSKINKNKNCTHDTQ